MLCLFPRLCRQYRNANMDFPTGNIKDADEQFVVRVAGKFKSIEDLRRLVSAAHAREAIYIWPT